MKIIKIILLNFLFGLFLISCNQSLPVDSNAECLEGVSKISKETAILIGKGYAGFDYDLRNCDVFVTEEAKGWRVKFEMVKEHEKWLGGCPKFLISKQTGEILETELPK